MSSSEMKENKTNKGFIPREDELIESPIKMHEEDDWNQYSDDDHDFTLVQGETQKRNNSIVYESNKSSCNKNVSSNNFSFVNKNEKYYKNYKKPMNDKRYPRTNDYQERHEYTGKSVFSNKNNYDKKSHKSDKYNYKDNNKQYVNEDVNKNYSKENFHYTEESDKGLWKRGDQTQSENWNGEYNDVISNDNFDKYDKEYNKNYSDNYDYKKKNNSYHKSSGYTHNNNYNDSNFNENYSETISNNNKYYSKKGKGYESYKNYNYTEKHFTNNDYPKEKTKKIYEFDKYDVNLNQNNKFSKDKLVEIIPCENFEKESEKKTNNQIINNTAIQFSEKKTFTNSNIINNSNNTTSPTKPINSVTVNNNLTNYNNNIHTASQINTNSNISFKVKSTPPQNKFNNPEVNLSPLINRNLPNNPGIQNLTSLEESAREKALNLNSASYYPSKWKDKNPEGSFNKYDMKDCIQNPQNMYHENAYNYQYSNYNEYPKQIPFSHQNLTQNPIHNPIPTQYQYPYTVNTQMMPQQMMYTPIIQPISNYPSTVMHPVNISNNPNVYFNNFGLLNK